MMNYKIAIFSNSTKILEQELDVGTYILGRSQTADIRLDIPEVSRKHLEIIVDENGIILTNLSSHGSFWNKKVNHRRSRSGAGRRITSWLPWGMISSL